MANLNDMKTALDIEQVIRRLIRDELDKRRPAPRYAVVNSIDLVDRSVMATFVGDTEEVRIPFLDVIPSAVGQEVRVTGTGSDRTVDAVRGTNDAEARIAEMEAEMDAREPAFCSWYRASNGSLSAGLTKLAWSSQSFEPVNMPALIAGTTETLIPTDGYYHINLRINYDGSSSKDFYVQVLPVTGSNYDALRVGMQIDDATLPHSSVTGQCIRYLYAGDRLCVNAAGANAFDIFGGERNTIWEIRRLYAGPLIVAPPAP